MAFIWLGGHCDREINISNEQHRVLVRHNFVEHSLKMQTLYVNDPIEQVV